MTIIAVALLAVACGSCNNAGNGNAETEEQEQMLCGGFTDQREITAEEMEMFKTVTGEGDLVLTPLSVSTQVVAGLNYKFWCRYEDPATGSGHCWVKIYRPLQGDPTLTSITKED